MAEQQELFNPKSLNPHQFPPVEAVQEGARTFTGGHHTTEGLEDQINSRFQGHAISAAYHRALQEPERPALRRSYQSFRNDVNNQYDFMTRSKEEGGLGLTHEVVHDRDPYGGTQDTAGTAAGARQMAEDVRGGRIRTLSTESTGGHALLSNEENDKFRAVHDVFGHAATGRGFDAPGEEVAYLSHRQMFSKRSLQAMTSETRGQNAYLNYRRGIPGYTAGEESQFPPQTEHLVGLPASASRVRRPRK